MANKDKVPEKVEEEPKITNDKEGGKKQKEAAKRLSEYNKEVSARKSKAAKVEEDKNPDPVIETSEDAPAEEPVPVEEPASSALSMGNTIAAVGVGVAILCLYLSYSTPAAAPSAAPPDAGPGEEEEAPRKRRPAKIPVRAKPKFKNLDS